MPWFSRLGFCVQPLRCSSTGAVFLFVYLLLIYGIHISGSYNACGKCDYGYANEG